jgi:hypothetical protein
MPIIITIKDSTHSLYFKKSEIAVCYFESLDLSSNWNVKIFGTNAPNQKSVKHRDL